MEWTKVETERGRGVKKGRNLSQTLNFLSGKGSQESSVHRTGRRLIRSKIQDGIAVIIIFIIYHLPRIQDFFVLFFDYKVRGNDID
jgi:hypothetical protein